MKFILFITLLFQLSCKEDQKINNELEETRKRLEDNRKYEVIKGCRVIAFPEVIYSMPLIAIDPAGELLLENRRYLKIPDPLVRSVAFEDIGAVDCLLKAGHDPNSKGKSLGTGGKPDSALHWAVFKNNPRIVILLVEAGADVHERHKDGTNYLLFFAEGEVKEILKAHGAK